MNKYNKYRIEDFVWDQEFRQWVLSPNRENNRLWTEWLAQNPSLEADINAAREIVLSLKMNEPQISVELQAETVSKIIKKVKGKEKSKNEEKLNQVPIFSFWVKIAAILAVFVGISWFVFLKLNVTSDFAFRPTILKEDISGATSMEVRRNESDSTQKIVLIDGSKVWLKPNGSIRYSKDFNLSKRDIYLSGNAFFEVVKNPDKPFFVYTKDLVTKVLGTSFTVDAYDDSKDITVSVKTGRVSVFAPSDPNFSRRTTDLELEGVILNPNQKITFNKKEVRMVKSIIDEPSIILPQSYAVVFDFEETPANQVFDKIAKAYGIEILYDKELLKGCPLTAYLDSQNLYEKLNIVCKAVEAQYEIIDGQIFIYSHGCQSFK